MLGYNLNTSAAMKMRTFPSKLALLDCTLVLDTSEKSWCEKLHINEGVNIGTGQLQHITWKLQRKALFA